MRECSEQGGGYAAPKSVGMSHLQLKVVAGIAVASMVPAAPLCLIMTRIVMLVPDASFSISHSLFCSEDAVKYAETVPQTSATILGLANFGFLLGVRLNNPRIRIQYDSMGIAFAAIAVITVLQMTLIIDAHGDGLYQPFYRYAMSVTTVALVLVGFCFVRIVVVGSRAGDEEAKHTDGMVRAKERRTLRSTGPDSTEDTAENQASRATG